MNIKDFLLPLGLALLTTWAIQYFFFGGKDKNSFQDRSGQCFTAPETMAEQKPLVREIDFVDTTRTGRAELTTIETPLANYIFSTDGGILYRFDAKRNTAGSTQTLTTIFPLAESDRENRCFLIALPNNTPYFFSLKNIHHEGGLSTITYEYQDANLFMTKKFTVFHDSYRVDLETTIEPKKSETITSLRLMFPSPLLIGADIQKTGEVTVPETINALVAGATGSVQKIPVSKISSQSGWFAPAIFGTESKYFVNAMVDDKEQLVQRGYYSVVQDRLITILETKPVTQKTTWHVSLYVGPKEEQALLAVNPRLESVVEYSGWLAPIARAALGMLNWLYSYLHNYGLAIIALTILLRLLLMPFTWRAEHSAKQTKELRKKLQYLEHKYKDNPAMLQQQKTELIRKHGVPGLSGCLPLLVQIPVFFALNRVLSTSIELYNAPFGGWITDLSAKDPYYILPILIVLAMFLQAATSDAQQRFAVIFMALFFGAIAVNLSAGLCLYILVSTLLGIGQTMFQRVGRAA